DTMVRALQRPVVAQLANCGGQISVVGCDGASVAEPAQIFLDDEAQADGVAEFADREAVASRADSLRAVLDHQEIVSSGEARDGRHVWGQAVKVHRHNGAGTRGNRRL